MHLGYLVLTVFLGQRLGKPCLFINTSFFSSSENSHQPYQVHAWKFSGITGKHWEMSAHICGFVPVLSRCSYCCKGEEKTEEQMPESLSPSFLSPSIHLSLPLSSHPPVVSIGDLSCLCSLKFLHFQHKLTDPVKAATGTFTVPPGWASLHGCHGLQFPPGCQLSQGSLFPTFSSALYELKDLGALGVDRDGEAG